MLTLVTNPARPHCFTNDDDWDGWCAKWYESESRQPRRSDVCGDCAEVCSERQVKRNQHNPQTVIALDPQRVRSRRLELGLTQLAVFRQSRVSQTTICYVESGR